jgi:hypothetical protein
MMARFRVERLCFQLCQYILITMFGMTEGLLAH